MKKELKVFLVDDEPLALKRLSRLLKKTNKVEIVGQTNSPFEALKIIPDLELDSIFLDIQMPELNGFELLQNLATYPPIIFTTAFDEFALKAFEVYSVDYLLKPIESKRLKLTLEKLEKIVSPSSKHTTENIKKLLESFARNHSLSKDEPIERIASRIGGRVRILDVHKITHFVSQDKLTFAVTPEGKEFPLDDTLNKLEERLDARNFLRVHRSSIVNLNFVTEVHGWFSGRILIRLRNIAKTEIVVARSRVRILKDLLGM